MPDYSFTITNPNCPKCKQDLTQKNAVTVQARENLPPIKTNIGTTDEFHGHIMDGIVDDATLILATPFPNISCSNCSEILEAYFHRE